MKIKLGIITPKKYILTKSDLNLLSVLNYRELSILKSGESVAETLFNELEEKIDAVKLNENCASQSSITDFLVNTKNKGISKGIMSIVLDDVSFLEKLERTLLVLRDSAWMGSYVEYVAKKELNPSYKDESIDEIVFDITLALTRLFTHLFVIELEIFSETKDLFDTITNNASIVDVEAEIKTWEREYDRVRESQSRNVRLSCYEYLMK